MAAKKKPAKRKNPKRVAAGKKAWATRLRNVRAKRESMKRLYRRARKVRRESTKSRRDYRKEVLRHAHSMKRTTWHPTRAEAARLKLLDARVKAAHARGDDDRALVIVDERSDLIVQIEKRGLRRGK